MKIIIIWVDIIQSLQKISRDVWKKLLVYNPNNNGNWSDDIDLKELNTTFSLEREVINALKSLYWAKKNIKGYLASGATEGNILSTWMGREYLKKKTAGKICLLKTNLTHSSVSKSADIVDIKQFVIPLNGETWGMDAKLLTERIKKLYKGGYRGFLIPLTIGYNIGSSDDYKQIIKLTRTITKKRNIELFFWLDAAWNGLIEPFISNKFKPFGYSEIKTLVVDFHKFFAIPYPAGMILYRSNLERLIERKVIYSGEKDITLLGSRPGASAAACWSAIHYFGKISYRKKVNILLKNKTQFISRIKEISRKIKVITSCGGLTAGVIFQGLKRNKLPSTIDKKYNLLVTPKISLLFENNKVKDYYIYRFHFIVKYQKSIIDKFINEVKCEYQKKTE